jgi:hypothetical protein
MSYLTGLTNPNSDKDVRQALTPLNEMLVRNRCAGVMLRHLNKNDKTSQALYRGMASVAFGALARTGFAVAKDPDSAGGYVFAPTKNNVSRYPASLKYRIADVDLGDGFTTSRIEWHGESERSAEELVTAFGAEASKAANTEQLLAQWLGDGPILSDELWERAQEAGIAFRTYRRVKEDVLHCRAGQYKNRCTPTCPSTCACGSSCAHSSTSRPPGTSIQVQASRPQLQEAKPTRPLRQGAKPRLRARAKCQNLDT